MHCFELNLILHNDKGYHCFQKAATWWGLPWWFKPWTFANFRHFSQELTIGFHQFPWNFAKVRDINLDHFSWSFMVFHPELMIIKCLSWIAMNDHEISWIPVTFNPEICINHRELSWNFAKKTVRINITNFRELWWNSNWLGCMQDDFGRSHSFQVQWPFTTLWGRYIHKTQLDECQLYPFR